MPSDAVLHAETDTSGGSRHYVPSEPATMRAAIDVNRDISSQAMRLPCVQSLILMRGTTCQAMSSCMQQ